MSSGPSNQPIDPLANLNPENLLKQALASAGTAPTEEKVGNSQFVPPRVDELNALLPQFEVLDLLGRGGMGAVYKARQSTLDRFVAIKILPPQVGRNPAFAERFSREAKALARLNHPNIVSVHDAGSVALPNSNDKLYYFVMEFVDGASLRQVIRDGKLSTDESLAIVPQVCEALQYAHDEGIVHRDIKPDNILLDTRGRVKIADFGLAKLLDQNAVDVTLTGTHQVMGTLRYMAPEQMQGTKSVDHRADIYSLGVVFYELLTGDVPMGRFAAPSKKVRIDVRLDEVVLRALEQEPDKRYQHASEVKTEVEGISSTPRPMVQSSSTSEEPVTYSMQALPRDLVDTIAGGLASIPILLIYVLLPILLFSVVLIPLPELTMPNGVRVHYSVIALFAGCMVFLGLCMLLGLGSIHRLTVDSHGLTFHRQIGPSHFLDWHDILQIRELTWWDAFRQVWLWPGLPPRGSIIGCSLRHYFRVNARSGCWYFCPNNPHEFAGKLRVFSRGSLSVELLSSTIEIDSSVTSSPQAGVRSRYSLGRVLLSKIVLFAIIGVVLVSAVWYFQYKSQSIIYTYFGDTGFLESEQGPVLSDAMVRKLGIPPAQRTAANSIFQKYYQEFITLERRHTRHTRDDAGHIHITISPFPDESLALVIRLQEELGGIVDQRVAPPLPEKGKIHNTLGLFRHAGEATVKAELWRDKHGLQGHEYHMRESVDWIDGSSSGGRGNSGYSPDAFPTEYRLFWSEAGDSTAATTGGL